MMKLFFPVAIVLLTTILSCQEEDVNQNSTFKKEDFYGVWLEKDHHLLLVKWDSSGFYSGTHPTTNFSEASPYTFDGETFTIFNSGREFKYEISSKTSTTFKATIQNDHGVKSPKITFIKLL